MKKAFQCAVILLSFGAAAPIPAQEPAPSQLPGVPVPIAPGKPKSAAPAPAVPAGPEVRKAPATTPAAQAAEPDRIDPTEKVRADSEISFPVDI